MMRAGGSEAGRVRRNIGTRAVTRRACGRAVSKQTSRVLPTWTDESSHLWEIEGFVRDTPFEWNEGDLSRPLHVSGGLRLFRRPRARSSVGKIVGVPPWLNENVLPTQCRYVTCDRSSSTPKPPA